MINDKLCSSIVAGFLLTKATDFTFWCLFFPTLQYMNTETERRCIVSDTHSIMFERSDTGFMYTVHTYVKNSTAYGFLKFPEALLKDEYNIDLHTYLTTRLQESWDIPLNRTMLFKHEVSDKYINSLIQNIQYQINAYSATTKFVKACDLVGIRDILQNNVGGDNT